MFVTFCLHDMGNVPIGGYKVIYEYANKFSKYGISVNIVYDCSRFMRRFPVLCWNTFIKKCMRPLRYPRNKWFDFSNKINFVYAYHGLVESDVPNADIIFATAYETAEDVYKLSAEKGKKFYFIQGFENWNHSNEEVYASYGFGMINIVVAKWLKDIVDQHSKFPAYLVSNCIDTDVFFDQKLNRHKHSIVFHYRSAEFKGARYAIEVIKKLKEKYSDLIVEVISIEDKPDFLPEYCKFHHNITTEEVAKINNRTEVFMCTTIEEGFGLPGLEAMACGCAVASSLYKGVLEYAVDGVNALLSPIRDVDIMVENVIKLYDNDELRKMIAQNGIETGKNNSLEKSAKELERILMKECEKL